MPSRARARHLAALILSNNANWEADMARINLEQRRKRNDAYQLLVVAHNILASGGFVPLAADVAAICDKIKTQNAAERQEETGTK